MQRKCTLAGFCVGRTHLDLSSLPSQKSCRQCSMTLDKVVPVSQSRIQGALHVSTPRKLAPSTPTGQAWSGAHPGGDNLPPCQVDASTSDCLAVSLRVVSHTNTENAHFVIHGRPRSSRTQGDARRARGGGRAARQRRPGQRRAGARQRRVLFRAAHAKPRNVHSLT